VPAAVLAWSDMRNISGFALGLVLAATVSTAAHSEGTVPAVGDTAPAFSLPDERGQVTKLDDYRGKLVVLYFYPKDFTSGCTMEARNFQRDLAKYEDAGAAILGVSFDTSSSHQDFCAKEGLSFKLLSDQDGAISSAYGSVMDHNGTKLSARNTFIIDGEGKVVKVFTGVKPMTHSEEVLAALSELGKPASHSP
jgi:peroxiredoxin Q/BCP